MPRIQTEGYHDVKVTNAVFGESSNGTPQLRLTFVNGSGDNIDGFLYFSDKCAEKSIETLKDCFEFDGNFRAVSQLEGQDCNIKVLTEEFKGKTQYRVAFINPPQSGVKALSDDNILTRLSALAGFAGPAVPVKQPQRTQAPAQSAPAEEEDPW